MISKRVYTKEYISRFREGSKCDPAILERSVFALGLLEAFARTGADFIFKGGTSLMLLLISKIKKDFIARAVGCNYMEKLNNML